MTTMITEVYEAFKAANVDDAKAIAAATAIPSKDNLVTKEDLAVVHQDILKMEARLDRRMDFLEAKIDRFKNDIILKLGGLMVVGFTVLGVLIKIL